MRHPSKVEGGHVRSRPAEQPQLARLVLGVQHQPRARPLEQAAHATGRPVDGARGRLAAGAGGGGGLVFRLSHVPGVCKPAWGAQRRSRNSSDVSGPLAALPHTGPSLGVDSEQHVEMDAGNVGATTCPIIGGEDAHPAALGFRCVLRGLGLQSCCSVQADPLQRPGWECGKGFQRSGPHGKAGGFEYSGGQRQR